MIGKTIHKCISVYIPWFTTIHSATILNCSGAEQRGLLPVPKVTTIAAPPVSWVLGSLPVFMTARALQLPPPPPISSPISATHLGHLCMWSCYGQKAPACSLSCQTQEALVYSILSDPGDFSPWPDKTQVVLAHFLPH